MEVKAATSFDERFDPQNVLNQYYSLAHIFRDKSQFWMTTGLYPQELLIDLGGAKQINEVRFMSTNGKLYLLTKSQ